MPTPDTIVPVPQTPEGTGAIPVSQPAAPPLATAGDAVKPAPIAARRTARSRRIALAAAAVVAALVWARYLVAGEEYDPADAFFASEAATAGSPAEPIASAPATPSAPAAAAPVAPAPATPATPDVRPIAREAVAETPRTPPSKHMKAVAEASAATAVATPVAAREPEEAPAAAADAGATEVAPSPAAAATTTVDEVTITGCLEIDTDQTRFRLADTEGASAPKARSWRSGFFKKRAAPVDLVGSGDALSLQQQVGQRVAATGVLTSRTLKVSSVRVVSASCN